MPEPAREPRRHVRSGSSSDWAPRDGLPTDLGLGLGLRTVHYGPILSQRPPVDFFEIISENFMGTEGRPLYILDQVAEAKPERVVLVVGPGPQGKRIHEYASRRGDLKIEHVVQSEPLGLGHAVAQAKDLVGGAPALIVLGDTIALAPFARLTAGSSSLGVREVDDPCGILRGDFALEREPGDCPIEESGVAEPVAQSNRRCRSDAALPR